MHAHHCKTLNECTAHPRWRVVVVYIAGLRRAAYGAIAPGESWPEAIRAHYEDAVEYAVNQQLDTYGRSL